MKEPFGPSPDASYVYVMNYYRKIPALGASQADNWLLLAHPEVEVLLGSRVRLMGRVQQNAVLVKGKQTVVIIVMKSTEASTLAVVDGIKKMIPRAEQVVPKGVTIRLLDDASTFVKDSIQDVVVEMLTAATLAWAPARLARNASRKRAWSKKDKSRGPARCSATVPSASTPGWRPSFAPTSVPGRGSTSSRDG